MGFFSLYFDYRPVLDIFDPARSNGVNRKISQAANIHVDQVVNSSQDIKMLMLERDGNGMGVTGGGDLKRMSLP